MSEMHNETEYSLIHFLAEHTVGNNECYTHTSMTNGKYNINEKEIDIFYKLYEKACLNNTPLYITERTKDLDYGPIIIDLDFKYDIEVENRQHTETHINQIVKIYNETMIDILDLDVDDDRLKAFVFEREDMYSKNGVKKDGIHILYPKIITFPQIQIYIRECILKKIKPILEGLPLTNPVYDIVDKSVIYSNPWLLYGSRKPKCELYNLTHIYDQKLNGIEIEDFDFESSNIAQYFSVRNKKKNEVIHLKEEKKDLVETTSTDNGNNMLKSSHHKLGTDASNQLNIKTRIQRNLSKSANIDIEEIHSLVNILNIERIENYTDWISLGWLLHNIDPSSQELLDLWVEYSRKSNKFKEGTCEKEWCRANNEGLGLATLHYWARNDNPAKYKEIIEKSLNRLIEISIKSPTHTDIAKVLHRLYEYEFVFSDNDWYRYKDHIWVKEGDATGLRILMSNDVPKIYVKVINTYNKIITSSEMDISEQEKEDCKNKTKEILNIIKQLKTVSFKDNIIKESKEYFKDEEFHKKLNTNNQLFAFKNGIYDLDRMEFRDGRPDDNISLNCNIDKIDFEETHEYYQDLKHFIDTIFVDEELRDYFLTYISTCLHGHNAEEKFRIWTGSGSNGKSKLIELIINSFGEYIVKFPCTLLTGKRGASNTASPEVISGMGRRFGYFEEPDSNEKINAGLLKEFTGGDKITGRALHKEQISFKPCWKLALLCNDIPDMPAHDMGTWRRMEIIEFKSKFTRRPIEPNEFPIDDQLSNKIKNWNEIFMSFLIDVYWVKYKRHGMKVPREVVKFTEEIQAECDVYIDFITDNLEKTDNKNDVLDINELYDEFKIWYEDTFSNHKFPSKKDVKTYLIKKYGKKIMTTRGLKGFKFKGRTEEDMLDHINHNDIQHGY